MMTRLDSLQEQLAVLDNSLPSARDVLDVLRMGHLSARPKTAGEKVREHLLTHPGDMNLSVRQLAAQLGVGKTTVNRIKQELQP